MAACMGGGVQLWDKSPLLKAKDAPTPSCLNLSMRGAKLGRVGLKAIFSVLSNSIHIQFPSCSTVPAIPRIKNVCSRYIIKIVGIFYYISPILTKKPCLTPT